MNKIAKYITAALLAGAMASTDIYPAFASQGVTSVETYSDSGPGSDEAVEAEKETEEAELRQTIIAQALGCMGVGYVWGGESPTSGMDCSGLIRYTIRQVLGIELPHSAAAQATLGTRISRDELQPGDLVFYSFEGKRIDHVAMYIGNGQIVHTSATKHKVVISNLDMGGTSPDAYVSLVGE